MFTSFFGGEFFAGDFFTSAPIPPVVVTVDKHDGGKKRVWKKRIEDRERLREQIRFALEGPRAEELREAAGVVGVPIEEIDYEAISKAYLAWMDEEDDIEMLLLS